LRRTFLHVAALDYDLIRIVSGAVIGPDFGADKHNPVMSTRPRRHCPTPSAGVADGAAVIQQQREAGLGKMTPFEWETGRHVVRNSYISMTGIEHSAEHFGQLVVYYHANNLVPPESRRQIQRSAAGSPVGSGAWSSFAGGPRSSVKKGLNAAAQTW